MIDWRSLRLGVLGAIVTTTAWALAGCTLPSLSGAGSPSDSNPQAVQTADSSEKLLRDLMTRSSNQCKKGVRAAFQDVDQNLKSASFDPQDAYGIYAEDKNQGTTVGYFGIIAQEGTPYFENGALVLTCHGLGSKTWVVYPTEDLPMEMKSRLGSGAATNDEVMQLALELDDSKISQVFLTYNTKDFQQGAVVGRLPVGPGQDRRRLGIRSQVGDLDSLHDARVVLPEDSDFMNAVTQVSELEAAISKGIDSTLAQAGI